MKLFDKSIYQNRRNKLKNILGSGQVLIVGNNYAPMNYTDNAYRFRQDSNFLYYFGLNLDGLVGFIDIDSDTEIIFGHELTIDEIIWTGPLESLSSLAEKVGVSIVKSPSALENTIDKSIIRYLPPYREDREIFIKKNLGLKQEASVDLIKAVVSQRLIKGTEEIEQMTKAVNITRLMHLTAMQNTIPGLKEFEVLAEVFRTLKGNEGEFAYPPIFSINGQTLHNHYHGNILLDGKLVLNDTGAEVEMAYAGDITRTYPVNGKFTSKQKDIYEIVLKMETDSIESLKPGVSYREVHLNSNKILLEGLQQLGLVNGNIDDMLTAGVGGLFMPHGLGHAIGLDVHDMEDLGEKYVGYTEELERSTQLGLKSLRFAKTLEAGHVLTVEPGCYFIPELLDKYNSEGIFKEYVNYSKLKEYYDFGGIRIEDNVLVTENHHEILGIPIPKAVEEVEEVMKR